MQSKSLNQINSIKIIVNKNKLKGIMKRNLIIVATVLISSVNYSLSATNTDYTYSGADWTGTCANVTLLSSK